MRVQGSVGYLRHRVSPKGGRKPTFFIDGAMSDHRKQALAEIERIGREIATSLGLEIVELVFHGQGKHTLLRIDVDRPGVPGVGLADCERLSRELSERIDLIESFQSPYELQVSSPGIDRPIRSDDDLRRNTGRAVRVEFRDEGDKVREIRGTLVASESPGVVNIAAADGEIGIARDRIVLLKQDVATGGGKRKNA